MENKQTAPKEIWVTRLEDFQSKNHIEGRGILTLNKVYLDSIKYLSETHVSELLEAKDNQIDGQRKTLQSFKDRYYEQIELIDSKNKELEYKDKEIEHLKLEIARLRENLEKDTCKCDDPDREAGYNYCYRCKKMVSDERMDEILKDN